jgi:hypothetical protein
MRLWHWSENCGGASFQFLKGKDASGSTAKLQSPPAVILANTVVLGSESTVAAPHEVMWNPTAQYLADFSGTT